MKIYSIFLFNHHHLCTRKDAGHYNNSPFKQLTDKLPTPNLYRTASGSPGSNYYQQRRITNIVVDLKMGTLLEFK